MIVTTTPSVEGRRIKEYKDSIWRSGFRRGLYQDIAAGFTNFLAADPFL